MHMLLFKTLHCKVVQERVVTAQVASAKVCGTRLPSSCDTPAVQHLNLASWVLVKPQTCPSSSSTPPLPAGTSARSASPSSASPALSLLEHPHSPSLCAPTATPSLGDWKEKSVKQKRQTHISTKTSFGSENFSTRLTVANIRLFLPLHHPCNINQVTMSVLRANTRPRWHQLQVLAVSHSPGETWPKTSRDQLLKTAQPWDNTLISRAVKPYGSATS